MHIHIDHSVNLKLYDSFKLRKHIISQSHDRKIPSNNITH